MLAEGYGIFYVTRLWPVTFRVMFFVQDDAFAVGPDLFAFVLIPVDELSLYSFTIILVSGLFETVENRRTECTCIVNPFLINCQKCKVLR